MISTGMEGTPRQSYSPKRARRILVKTLASRARPVADTASAPAPWRGRHATPATFMAK